jgi:hypothetical protein
MAMASSVTVFWTDLILFLLSHPTRASQREAGVMQAIGAKFTTNGRSPVPKLGVRHVRHDTAHRANDTADRKPAREAAARARYFPPRPAAVDCPPSPEP